MKAQFLLHVRTVGNRTVATPVELPGLAADSADASKARSKVISNVRQHLVRASPIQRLQFSEAPPAELMDVDVEKAGDEEADPVPIRVNCVVTRRLAKAGFVAVIWAPALPAFSFSVGKDAELEVKAARALRKPLKSMSLFEALALQTSGDVSLETVELEVQLPEPHEQSSHSHQTALGAEDVIEQLGARMGADQPPAGAHIREALVQRVLAALATPERSSVILVGRPDVGKTTLVRECAHRIATGDVAPGLKERQVWRISANDLMSGVKFIGIWQARAQALIKRARTSRDIFVLGDPAAIIDAGKHEQSDNNMARYLRPYMESGEITVICECTLESFEVNRKKEPSFMDAFHRIDVPEPNVEETRAILEHAAEALGVAESISVEQEAIVAALDLTQRYQPYRGLPGKAVRLLEESVRSITATDTKRVGRSEVIQAFAERTGMSLSLLSEDVPLARDEVHNFFGARVLGQENAIDAVVGVVMILKAALNSPNKPLATMLFMGPTGVGKTELAKAVAEFLFGSRDRLVRLDMGEYSTGDAVQRLTGTTWGHQSDGELTRKIRDQPFSVVLLDEIEKAHSSVFDALLSVIGEGRLTDADGQTSDFRNAIIVMTSNLGANNAQSGGIGFSPEGHESAARGQRRYVEQAEKFFRPEFFNRIDRILPFLPLAEDTVRKIARRELGNLLLREGIARRRILVEFDERVVDRLAQTGFHPRYGARPLQREIERAVIQPLAALINEKRPQPGDLISVSTANGSIDFAIERFDIPRPRDTARSRTQGQTRADHPLGHAVERVEGMARRIGVLVHAPQTMALRAEISRLVADMSEPNFWDRPNEAKRAMSRVYLLQRVMDDLDSLRNRGEGLVELARLLRGTRNRSRLPEVEKARVEIDSLADRLEIELAGAALGSRDERAHVRISAIGPPAAGWARELCDMYSAWAERTGRDCTARGGDRQELVVSGAAAYALLAGEQGLHRRITSSGDELVARVAVYQGDNGDGTEPLPRSLERTELVRLYDDRRRVVKDPRYGVQVKDPAAVLRDGTIDAFILRATAARGFDGEN